MMSCDLRTAIVMPRKPPAPAGDASTRKKPFDTRARKTAADARTQAEGAQTRSTALQYHARAARERMRALRVKRSREFLTYAFSAQAPVGFRAGRCTRRSASSVRPWTFGEFDPHHP